MTGLNFIAVNLIYVWRSVAVIHMTEKLKMFPVMPVLIALGVQST